jgi:hypothetical protein
MKRIGLDNRVIILAKVKDSKKKALERWSMENKWINNLFNVNGDWTFAAEALFPNIRTLESFMEDCSESIKEAKLSVLYILEDFKREAFLPGIDGHQKGSIK